MLLLNGLIRKRDTLTFRALESGSTTVRVSLLWEVLALSGSIQRTLNDLALFSQPSLNGTLLPLALVEVIIKIILKSRLNSKKVRP
jgi:hypothetical protein